MTTSREYVIECDHVTGDVWSPTHLFVDESVAHEVVRCRDCEHMLLGWCDLLEFKAPDMEEHGFCAWGVAKDGDKR